MPNNKTKPREVIEAVIWNSGKSGICHMSFGSSLLYLNELNEQKLHLHTKNSSLNQFEQDSSHSFPLQHDQGPPTTVTSDQTASTCMAFEP